MLLNSHISAYTRCLAEKVCGLVRSTWGTSQGEDKLGARIKILNTKVACRACAGQTFPLCIFALHDTVAGPCWPTPFNLPSPPGPGPAVSHCSGSSVPSPSPRRRPSSKPSPPPICRGTVTRPAALPCLGQDRPRLPSFGGRTITPSTSSAPRRRSWLPWARGLRTAAQPPPTNPCPWATTTPVRSTIASNPRLLGRRRV